MCDWSHSYDITACRLKMSDPTAIIAGMKKWYKKTYVCSVCDALIEISTKSDVLQDKNCFECKGSLTLLSVADATINPTQQKEEQTMETMTDTFVQTRIAELEEIISRQNSALTTHQNCDYWKAENGRVQSQIIDLINELFEEDRDTTEIAQQLCEIIDYEAKKEVSFTATITVTGRADVQLGEDVQDFLDSIEFSVDAYNGDVIIEDYSTNEVEES